jgi:hypothetical protein
MSGDPAERNEPSREWPGRFFARQYESRTPKPPPRTTKLYDRTSDEITLDEVERIAI